MKKYIIFILTFIMILSINIISYASTEEIDALINRKVSIIYNQELKEFYDAVGTKVYPITYQGTTYLPIRAISSLFSIPVEWDGENNKILLGKGELNESTAKTITAFIQGENEDVKLLLNKGVQLEYKERLQTFADANGVQVYPLTYNGTTYLPVRAISNMYGATINWDGEKQEITIARENKLATITNVTIKVIDDTICAVVTTDNPLYDYKYYSLTEPNRVILDLKNSQFGIEKEAQAIEYEELEQVRFGDQGDNLSRLVLDLTEIGTYTVVQSADRKTTYLALSDKFEEAPVEEESKDYVLVASIGDKIYIPDSDKEPTIDEDVKVSGDNTSGDVIIDIEINNSGDISASGDAISSGDIAISGDTYVSGDASSEDGEPEKGNDKEDDNELTEAEINKLAKLTSVTYSPSTDKTKIKISGNFEYEKFVLEDPKRLVIDIEDALLQVDGPTEITPKNKNIKEIRFSQNELTKVRIVFEFVNESDYKITQKNTGLEVSIEEPEYRNIKYEKFEDYATLTLLNTKTKVFDATENSKYDRYTLSYSSSKFDSGKSTLEIGDDFVDNIQIKSTKIIINGEDGMHYTMEQDGDNVVITISEKKKNTSKPESDGDFVILIDAGHGGTDPGACNGDDYEKIYNLKIALKLYEMLQDTEGVRVYISRDDDTYIGQQGRLDFATSRDDTDLYVSVHNNSAANKKYNGTMVLYYDKEYDKDYGITSKEFAELVLDELVTDLGTKNLGVVSRDDLWVLYYSEVPSILCEVSFVSNDDELARLKTDEFQETAATAIYNGIFAAKEQMER